MSNIAVIGSGISGMTAAHLLSRQHQVTLFEKATRLGGHTHTVRIETADGPLAVDMGFIVFNERNYPNLVALFDRLGVRSQASDMSFSVSDRRTGFEYSSRGASGFFADRTSLVRPSRYRLLAEILRFNRCARLLLEDASGSAAGDVPVDQWLDAQRFSRAFRRHFLFPMASAIWSTSLDEIGLFPAKLLARFLDNHGLLQLTGQPQWRVVCGGSASYIDPLIAPLSDSVVTGASIAAVCRTPVGVTLQFTDRPPMAFDEVVFACHGDQVLPLLDRPSPAERQVFSAFRTTRNETWLHTDDSVLPRSEAARASWNYHLGGGERDVTLTYHMNRLQSLRTREQYCVTLHPEGLVDASKVIARMSFNHPLYTVAALAAQARWANVSGVDGVHYCGAYWFNGFHEDGVRSAMRVADAIAAKSRLATECAA